MHVAHQHLAKTPDLGSTANFIPEAEEADLVLVRCPTDPKILSLERLAWSLALDGIAGRVETLELLEGIIVAACLQHLLTNDLIRL